MSTAYEQLEKHFHRLSTLTEVKAMLSWDSETMMPRGGASAREEQMAQLSALSHEIISAGSMGDLLEEAQQQSQDLTDWQQANLREMHRRWFNAESLPADLVEAMSRATSRCEMQWRTARAENDFQGLKPAMEEVFNLTRQQAKILAEKSNSTPYDALLSLYEPGLTQADIDPIFVSYEAFLPDFLAAVLDKQNQGPAVIWPKGPFPIDAQKRLSEKVMSLIGFDFNHGRLDVSAHPFSGGVPDDLRITTRYDEQDFTRALMGTVHETGHALYESGLPKDWRLQPVGEARGMMAHESQSLLMEMQAGRSVAFLPKLVELVQEAFVANPKDAAWSVANLQLIYHRVEPGLIRVDADEVTYPAHVILRYGLEKALIAGDLELDDLPEAWNEGLDRLLGVRPTDNKDGCLQDIHWFIGAIGYFPTYSLGAMTAAQLYQAAGRAIPDLENDLQQGDFSKLLAWLRNHIHSKGSYSTTQDMLEAATGKRLDPEVFKQHLRTRYLGA